MRKTALALSFRNLLLGFLSALALAAAATPARAGNVAFLSRSGSGTACTLAAPCAVMIAAVFVAGPSGEVICLDKGPYNEVIIMHSVTISCGDGLWEAPTGGININTPAGSDVVIEGLVVEGNGLAGSSIFSRGQGALHLRQVRVGNIAGSPVTE